MNKTALTWVVIILVLLGGYFIWKNNSMGTMDDMTNMPATNNTGSTDTNNTVLTPLNSTTTTTVVVPPVTTNTSAVKSFVIEGKSFSFTPSTITVNKGDTVKITLKNTGGFHDLRIDGYNVGTPQIQGGEESTFTFVADKAGTFEYYCSVGTHRQMGMKGTLTVQ
jgi:plastocyanin